MTRTITGAAETASQAEVVIPVAMVRLDFSSGIVAANSGVSTLTFNAEDYLGLGTLGTIEAVEEGSTVQMYGVRLTLSGIDTALISTTLNEDYQGRDASIYTGFLNSDHSLIADPVLVFDGRMDFMEITMGETATISLSAESKLVDWERARIRRFNNDDQIDRFPGDKGLEFVPQMVEKELVWGRG